MKSIKKSIGFFLFVVICSLNVNANGNHKKVTRLDSIQINGLWRTYRYHKPQFPGVNPRLVFVMHADGMTSKSIQTVTNFEYNSLADQTANTIVVYPQGYKEYWNDCRKGFYFDESIDDVAFIKALVRRMQVRHHIDYKNVFALGYLNGGNMCYKLAKSIPEVFKGFVIIGTNLPVNTIDECVSLDKPISMMLINYTSDTVNPYKGGQIAQADEFIRGEELSTNETFHYWVSLLGKPDKNPLTHSTSTKVNDKGSYTREDYFSVKRNKRVALLKILKGGYPFPNTHVDQWSQIVANIGKDLKIPETAMDFFYQLQYSEQVQTSE